MAGLLTSFMNQPGLLTVITSIMTVNLGDREEPGNSPTDTAQEVELSDLSCRSCKRCGPTLLS